MTVFYSKRRVFDGKKADPNSPKRSCPSCGKMADAVQTSDDRTVYKCSHCKAENTYTHPITSPKKKVNEEKLGVLTLRNTEKKDEKPKKEEKPEDTKKESAEIGERITNVRKGMKESKLVQFVYMDKSGKKSTRLVEPYKLMRDKAGDLILYAYCLDGQGIRVFKLAHTANVAVQDYTYVPRWPTEDHLTSK